MEGFTYNNIFETKALEYLIVVFFFLILIPLWKLLNKQVQPAVQQQSEPKPLTTNSIGLNKGIFYSRHHTWTHMEKNGEAKIGLNDLLLHLTGSVTIELLKNHGDEIEKGEVIATIKNGTKSLPVLSPVSGIISKPNYRLDEQPALLKNDPYGHGWIYAVKPENWKTDTNICYLAEDAVEWAKNELIRFKDFLAVASAREMPEPAGVAMQDGGELVEQALTQFPPEVWQEFRQQFLS